MRIIAGFYKGKKLYHTLGKDGIRATQDFVKESIFNILAQKYSFAFQSIVLDLFAGTGALGIESISRGAQQVIFVDNNINAMQLIRQNLSLLKNTEHLHISLIQNDSLKLDLAGIVNQYESLISLVYLDPPYHQGYVKVALDNLLTQTNYLFDNCIFIIEDGKQFYEYLQCSVLVHKKILNKYISILMLVKDSNF